jgi:hypothetical protein
VALSAKLVSALGAPPKRTVPVGKQERPEPILGKVNQETLAEMIGTTRPRVSFFMNKFRDLAPRRAKLGRTTSCENPGRLFRPRGTRRGYLRQMVRRRRVQAFFLFIHPHDVPAS